MLLKELIKSLPSAYDAAVNAAYNDGWNDAVRQCAKIVNAARFESQDLRSLVHQIKALDTSPDTSAVSRDNKPNP